MHRYAERVVGLGSLMALCGALGCNPGINWQLGSFEDVRRQNRDVDKLIFVYFRNWYMVECTQFEDRVLSSPEVLEQTNDMINIPLNYDWDQSLADRWGLDTAPAFVILDPQEQVLERGSGDVTKKELLDALYSARQKYRFTIAPDPDTQAPPRAPSQP